MVGRSFVTWCSVVLVACGTVCLTSLLSAQETLTSAEAPIVSVRALAAVSTPQSPVKPHPLDWVIKYAREEQAWLRQSVRDFTCRLVKRERINDELQDFQYIDMRVREEVSSDGRVVQPLSVFLEFIGPAEKAGRRVLFVGGRHDNRMLIRKGGKRFAYVVIDLDPNGESARQESVVPITQVGFPQMLGRTLLILERDMLLDPSGTNTKTEHIANATINGRKCDVVRVEHPQRREGLEFHRADVFIDNALQVPVRTDIYDWPKQSGEPLPVLAEYTYTDLKLNVGLDDAAFDQAALRAP